MITDSQDEQTLEDLFRDADQIQIPIFQREYVWTNKEFSQLLSDIDLIRSGQENSQFLGAIVTYENKRPKQPIGRLKTYSIVDGQQRILTLYIFLIALVESFANIGKKEEALDIVNEFLLIPPRRGLDINTRLFPAFADRNQFRVICDKINTPEVLQEQLGDIKINPPSPNGEISGKLISQYSRIIGYLKKEIDNNPSQKNKVLEEVFDIIVRRLTFVHLLLNDASGANEIFERLNFRGRRVGTIDLVRNEIFSGLMDDPVQAQKFFSHNWNPFVSKFNGRSDNFFFPYCLIHNSNTTKSELFSQLRQIWNLSTPEKIINHMTRFQGPFMSIDLTGYFSESPNISIRLDRLVRMKRPTSIYPFIMSILDARIREELDEKHCVDLLDVTETFLVRRAILGFEPTGLHALFKGLWKQLNDYSIEEFKLKVGEKPTIQWPNNNELREAIRTRPLAKAKICNYILVEYDRDLPGDNPTSIPSIEHILPQSYDANGAWAKIFTKDEHKKLKDTWANLVPLSSPLNSSLQASPYSVKKGKYRDESMFITPRRIADDYPTWTVDTINQRAQVLFEWASKRWPFII